MALPFEPSFPWLLYAYPWMPFPRRVIIYLREKGIPESLVKVARVTDPQNGNAVVDSSLPARPAGSLPILAIPSMINEESSNANQWVYIRQSMSIINYLEELCNTGGNGFSSPHGPMIGTDPLSRARIGEILSLAEECTIAWNPVRTFGTNAGTMSFPQGSKEMLRWVRRSLLAIETWWQESDRDMSVLIKGVFGSVTIADVVLYQFLEFTKDCYDVDMTIGSGETVRDVYGREVIEKFPKLTEFYQAFSTRDSTIRYVDQGEVASEGPRKAMQTWAPGAL